MEQEDKRYRGVRAKRNRSWTAFLILACVGVLWAQRPAGRWELIDYGPTQIALWLTASSRVTNPNATNAYDRQGLPLMTVQCLEGKPTFFVNIQFELPGERLPVTYRLDDGKPVTTVWKIDGHIAIAPEDTKAFVQLLLDKEKLVLTLEFPNGPTTTSFEIAHLEEAMRLLAGRCSWSKL